MNEEASGLPSAPSQVLGQRLVPILSFTGFVLVGVMLAAAATLGEASAGLARRGSSVALLLWGSPFPNPLLDVVVSIVLVVAAGLTWIVLARASTFRFATRRLSFVLLGMLTVLIVSRFLPTSQVGAGIPIDISAPTIILSAFKSPLMALLIASLFFAALVRFVTVRPNLVRADDAAVLDQDSGARPNSAGTRGTRLDNRVRSGGALVALALAVALTFTGALPAFAASYQYFAGNTIASQTKWSGFATMKGGGVYVLPPNEVITVRATVSGLASFSGVGALTYTHSSRYTRVYCQWIPPFPTPGTLYLNCRYTY